MRLARATNRHWYRAKQVRVKVHRGWQDYEQLLSFIWLSMYNRWPVLVSDYAEDKQVNDGNIADFIELQPSGELHLPRNRQLQALNRPFVMWEAWDVIKIVAR